MSSIEDLNHVITCIGIMIALNETRISEISDGDDPFRYHVEIKAYKECIFAVEKVKEAVEGVESGQRYRRADVRH